MIVSWIGGVPRSNRHAKLYDDSFDAIIKFNRLHRIWEKLHKLGQDYSVLVEHQSDEGNNLSWVNEYQLFQIHAKKLTIQKL